MMKSLVWLFITIPFVNSSSSTGCLRYENDQCKICDTSRFYFSDSNGKCEKKMIDNCQIPNHMNMFGEGSCLRCDKGYYLSNVTNKCTTVPVTQQDQNCVLFSQLAECLECGPGYIITNGVCAPPENSISNCESQTSETECAACEEGYILNNNECKTVSIQSNCVVESDFVCNACKSSFALSPNSYASVLLSDQNYTFQPDKTVRFSDVAQSSKAYDECIDKTITSCEEYNSFGKCSKCVIGFHVDTNTGMCLRSPEPKIYQCASYSSISTCIRCNEGYYLSSNECLIQEAQELCMIAKTTSTGCSVCEDNYYSNNGTCKLRDRSLSVSHCTLLKNDKDECSTCGEGFIISSDGGKCFVPIAHCQVHNSVSSSDQLTCQSCASTTIPTPDATAATSCELRNNIGCQEFEVNSNECKTCLNNSYYKDTATGLCKARTKSCKNGDPESNNCIDCYPQHYKDPTNSECKRHTKINCNDYSLTEDACSSCNSGFYVDSTSKECLPYNLQNCSSKDTNSNTCTTCGTGFYPISTTVCKRQDLIGCQTPGTNVNTCSLCMSGYYKTSSNLCLPHTLRGCTDAGRSDSSNTCSACEAGFYLNTDHCLPYTVTNCKAYEATSDNCQTGQCEDGYQEESGKCLLIPTGNCTTYNFTTLACTTCATNYAVENGVCEPQYLEGCEDYVLNEKECSKCHIGWKLVSNACERNEIDNCITEDTATGKCTKCASAYLLSATGTCTLADTPGCTAYDADTGACTNAVDNYYELWGTEVKKVMFENCVTYDTTSTTAAYTCSECIDGYSFTATVAMAYGQCSKITPIPFCLNFVTNDTTKCGQCQNLYFPNVTDQTTCAPITNLANCIKSSGIANTCTACKPDYFLDTGVCTAISDSRTPNCTSNSATANTTSCDNCNAGHFLIYENKTLVEAPEYCESYTASTDTCTQYLPGWELKDGEPVEADAENSDCLQLKSSTFDLLSSSGNCGKCRDSMKTYLSSNDCVARTTLSFDKCHIYNEAADACVACKEGLEYSSTTGECSTTALTTVTNCKYTMPGGGCYQCDTGFIVDSTATTPNTCIAFVVATHGSNCRLWDGSNCTACSDGFLLDSSNACFEPKNCKKRNSSNNSCEVCPTNYKYDSTDEHNCVYDTDSSECEYFSHPIGLSQTSSVCLKCKENDALVLNHETATNNIHHFSCVKTDIEHLKNTSFYFASSKYQTFSSVSYSERLFYKTLTTTDYNDFVSQRCLPMNLQNCETVGTTGASGDPVCTKCYTGNMLSNGKCVPGHIEGCLEYTDFETCTKCSNSYQLANDACTKVPLVEGCVSQKPGDSVCNQCLEGYVLLNGNCHLQKVPNCSFPDPLSMNCLECQNNYYLDGGICRPYSITNCEVKSWKQDRCVTCIEGFYNEDGYCLKNTTLNCINPSTLTNKCLECEPGYFLQIEESSTPDVKAVFRAGNCIKRNSDPYCLRFNPVKNHCETCMSGYFMLAEENICMKYTVKFCLHRASVTDSCLVCEPGYYLNEFGQCNKHIVQNCSVYSSNSDSCDQCINGYYLTTSYRCTSYTIQNCDLFDANQDACITCLPGYYMNTPTSCTQYRRNANCSRMEIDRDVCAECNPGFFNNLGSCDIRLSQNCLLYKQDEDLCLSCEAGFYLENNSCLSYSVVCQDYNQFSNSCVSCQEGYYLFESLCYINDALNCKEFSTIRRGCSSCNDSDYLDLNSGSCMQRNDSTNCARALLTADLCESCPSTHIFTAGKCTLRAKDNCASYDSINDICTSCHNNKNWYSNGICEEYTIENCVDYEPDADLCKECVQGSHYLGADKLCHPSTPLDNCELYSTSEDKCVFCKEGYYLVNGNECRPNPTGLYNCIEYSDNETCLKCTSGFYLQDNFCFKSRVKIDNCDMYSDNIQCAVCKNNYILVDNPAPADDDTSALPVGHPNRPLKICTLVNNTTCKEWKDIDNCSACSGNQVLKTLSNGTVECADSGIGNCMTASGTSTSAKCELCEEFYAPSSSKDSCSIASPEISNCKYYSKATECSQCNTGYALNSDKDACVKIELPKSVGCDNGQLNSSNICKACAPNYYLDTDSKCNKCGGDNCDICNPYNLEECWLCLPGFEHDGKVCNSPAVESDDGTSGYANMTEDRNEVSDHDNGEGLFKKMMSMMILTLIFVLNK